MARCPAVTLRAAWEPPFPPRAQCRCSMAVGAVRVQSLEKEGAGCWADDSGGRGAWGRGVLVPRARDGSVLQPSASHCRPPGDGGPSSGPGCRAAGAWRLLFSVASSR